MDASNSKDRDKLFEFWRIETLKKLEAEQTEDDKADMIQQDIIVNIDIVNKMDEHGQIRQKW